MIGDWDVSLRPTGFGGQGFSLRGEKARFVLPPKLRNRIFDSTGERTLCIGQHSKWPCLTGFGLDRQEHFDTILDREQRIATELGREFDRDEMMLNLWDFEEVPFDKSGRFVLPDTVDGMFDVSDAIYFQGVGEFITMWNPQVLLAQEGPNFRGPQAKCQAEMTKAEAKRK